MTKVVCPKCKSSEDLSVEVKVNYDLVWSDCSREYEIGEETDRYGFKSFDDDSEVSCGCGWTGEYRRLVPATKKYRVVLLLDIDPKERGPVKDWDWKDLLGMDDHETVVIDGVNEL